RILLAPSVSTPLANPSFAREPLRIRDLADGAGPGDAGSASGLLPDFLIFRPSGAAPGYARRLRRIFDSDPEQGTRPPGEQVVDEHEEDEQGQEHGHEAQSDPGQPPVQTARLLLLCDRTLLELDHALQQSPVLGELITLRIADVAQEMPDVVVAVHSRGPGLRRDILTSSAAERRYRDSVTTSAAPKARPPWRRIDRRT